MTARIIDGKAAAARLLAAVKDEVGLIAAAGGRMPGLAVVLVGDDPASQVYVRNKGVQTARAGMGSFETRLPATASQTELLDCVRELNEREDVDGILVQLPLPRGLDATAVVNAIDPAKDVDGLHPLNAGKLASGQDGLVPCTPRGCMALLAGLDVTLAGMHAVVVGRSTLVGRPVAQLLLWQDCTVTIAHSRTRDLAALCRTADILVAATGRAGLIGAEHVRPGAVVIDVGINRVVRPDGSAGLVGDVDFAAVAHLAGAITPVPGGVGPMTIACLLQNTLDAYRTRRTERTNLPRKDTVQGMTF